ncbi:MAG TPA: 16S rRNA (guanine(966)-N(2))-methyltransferase RsmD [Alphaproteobacteria bacterium]|nr:16S rRNA (guanine(966)-N(2))-methyltransferase RsmD [Alphaproteobacteria bacterium]
MRIIGGLWRRRRLLVPAGHDIRPTADRTRESLFSILENSGNYACWPLADATVLDIFAGTGALGLEALSRGAKQAVFIDDNATSIATVNHNLETLEAAERAIVLLRDATQPGPSVASATLVFLDPPYRSGLAEKALTALVKTGWLNPGALAMVETEEKELIIPPRKFTLVEKRNCGNAKLWFLRYF